MSTRIKNIGVGLYSRINEVLNCDFNTGLLTWNMSGRGVKKGNEAGYLDKSTGYIRVKINGETYRAHRLVYLLYYKINPENDIDHINRIKTDNRIANLREVNRSCNVINSKLPNNNTTGIRGVYLRKDTNRWGSNITVNKKRIHLGFFTSFDEAIQARYKAECKYGYNNCNACSSAKKYLTEKGLI